MITYTVKDIKFEWVHGQKNISTNKTLQKSEMFENSNMHRTQNRKYSTTLICTVAVPHTYRQNCFTSLILTIRHCFIHSFIHSFFLVQAAIKITRKIE